MRTDTGALGSGVVADDERGRLLRERRARMGISVSGLAEEAGVDRGVLKKLEAGENVRDTTIGKVTATLDRLEQEMGMDEVMPAIEQIEIVFEGRGVKLTMKAPIGDPDAAEAMAARLMRLIRDEG